MAGNSIRYEEGTDAVINTANKIEGIAEDFHKTYSDLFSLIQNDLSTVWKGDDSRAFIESASINKPHYDSMHEVMLEYAAFLRNTANAHNERMEDSRSQVQSNCAFGD